MISRCPSMRMWVVGVVLVALTVLVPLAHPPAVAAQTGVTLTPATLTVSIIPGSTANAVFTVRNETSVDRTITMTVTNLPTAGGAYAAVLSQNGVTLRAGTEQTITVTFVAPTTAVPGTYAGIQVAVNATPTAGQSGTITVTSLVNLTVVDVQLSPRVYLPLTMHT